jgi:hypothetical protein
MKMLSFALLAVAAVAVVPSQSAEAGRRGGCGCCGSVAYAAPAAASPAAAANVAPAATVAQNQGYRSFSYQPATTTMNTGGVYYSGGNRARSNQPIWANGANKSLGRVNP